MTAIAEGVHKQIAEKSETLRDEIQSSMENGELALDRLQDSEMFTLINEITTLELGCIRKQHLRE
jgi:hypothetical protein